MSIRHSIQAAVVAVVLACTAHQAAAEDRSVTIVNQSSETIRYIYGTNSADSNWGRDRLGSAVLRSGYEVKMDFEDGSGACMFDLKAITSGGRSVTRRMNVCTATKWTVYD